MSDQDCKHGKLARSCFICDLEKDVAELTAECERLREQRDEYARCLDGGVDCAAEKLTLRAELSALRESAKLAEAVAEALDQYLIGLLDHSKWGRVILALEAWRSHRAKSLEGGEGK